MYQGTDFQRLGISALWKSTDRPLFCMGHNEERTRWCCVWSKKKESTGDLETYSAAFFTSEYEKHVSTKVFCYSSLKKQQWENVPVHWRKSLMLLHKDQEMCQGSWYPSDPSIWKAETEGSLVQDQTGWNWDLPWPWLKKKFLIN